ncbi:unnamed protein product, partial [Sphacelaria rigidula]
PATPSDVIRPSRFSSIRLPGFSGLSDTVRLPGFSNLSDATGSGTGSTSGSPVATAKVTPPLPPPPPLYSAPVETPASAGVPNGRPKQQPRPCDAVSQDVILHGSKLVRQSASKANGKGVTAAAVAAAASQARYDA